MSFSNVNFDYLICIYKLLKFYIVMLVQYSLGFPFKFLCNQYISIEKSLNTVLQTILCFIVHFGTRFSNTCIPTFFCQRVQNCLINSKYYKKGISISITILPEFAVVLECGLSIFVAGDHPWLYWAKF